MKSYKLIYQLITLVEILEGENENKDLTLLDFAGFLDTSLKKTPANKQYATTPFGNNDKKTMCTLS